MCRSSRSSATRGSPFTLTIAGVPSVGNCSAARMRIRPPSFRTQAAMSRMPRAANNLKCAQPLLPKDLGAPSAGTWWVTPWEMRWSPLYFTKYGSNVGLPVALATVSALLPKCRNADLRGNDASRRSAMAFLFLATCNKPTGNSSLLMTSGLWLASREHACRSCTRKSRTSSSNCWTRVSLSIAVAALASIFMLFTVLANLSVVQLSSKFATAGLKVPIIAVREFPFNEFDNNSVNFELRNFAMSRFGPADLDAATGVSVFRLPCAPSSPPKLWMQLANHMRLRFM
mmetsp:Transcript_36967/g.106460  ORF Transcript_36967/g.106460 Transcript_36967/m.106460 type:complete len:286 (-) Transcript_36967:937-1794(-)